jgi:hypothetical protein
MTMKQLKRKLGEWSGLELALVAALSVLAWRGWVVARKPAHLMDMANELGSIGEFQHLADCLFPNHSNTCLVYSQYTEKGVGFFFCNLADQKKKLICEQAEKGWSWQKYGMLGWSPDDQFFACAYPPNDPRQPAEEIIVVNGATGEVVVKLVASNMLTEFAWLTGHSFANAFWDGENRDVAVVEQKPDGSWIQAQLFKQLHNKEMSDLMATSDHSVAWRQGASLRALDFAVGRAEKIWESNSNKLERVSYSGKDGRFNLTCSDSTHWFQIRFRLPTRLNPQGMEDNLPQTGDETKHAYLHTDAGTNMFQVGPDRNPAQVVFSWAGQVMNYQMNGDSLYVISDMPGEPYGIWKYDFNSGTSNRVVSALDHPLQYAKIVRGIFGSFTNSSGRLAHYQIWPPTHLTAGKKYPLVLGQTPYSFLGWMPYPQIAANGGCYCALVDRASWFGGLENWGEDVMAARDLMTKDPNVDAGQVYLFGASAETAPLTELLVEHPGMWLGAILFNPSATPDPSTVRISKLMILDGTDDGDSVVRWTRYQNQAALAGMAINLALINGAQHIAKSSGSEREKTTQLARFLFGD